MKEKEQNETLSFPTVSGKITLHQGSHHSPIERAAPLVLNLEAMLLWALNTLSTTNNLCLKERQL